jgi:hypothetical protein
MAHFEVEKLNLNELISEYRIKVVVSSFFKLNNKSVYVSLYNKIDSYKLNFKLFKD